MRYDSARLADFSDCSDSVRRPAFDGPFFVLSMLLLVMGVIMVLSSSFARAWYNPGNITGGNAAYYFVRQFVYALAGVWLMLAASRLPMRLYRQKLSRFW